MLGVIDKFGIYKLFGVILSFYTLPRFLFSFFSVHDETYIFLNRRFRISFRLYDFSFVIISFLVYIFFLSSLLKLPS